MTDEEIQELTRRAIDVRARAYAPYSKYHVGAALRTASGEVVVGVNVENASYGLTNCAERTAIFAAVAAGHREFEAVAVATENGAGPCGACRQVLAEFAQAQGRDFPVYQVDPSGAYTETTVLTLLPGAFGGDALE